MVARPMRYTRHGTTTPRRELHVAVDNYATHKHPWLNLVEVFFATTSRQALRRGDFSSVAELVAVIGRFVDAWNERCQPFRWVRDADPILGRLARQRSRPRRSGGQTAARVTRGLVPSHPGPW